MNKCVLWLMLPAYFVTPRTVDQGINYEGQRACIRVINTRGGGGGGSACAPYAPPPPTPESAAAGIVLSLISAAGVDQIVFDDL